MLLKCHDHPPINTISNSALSAGVSFKSSGRSIQLEPPCLLCLKTEPEPFRAGKSSFHSKLIMLKQRPETLYFITGFKVKI